ncbi:MAG TPA: hypothetical protein VMA36_14030 [Candidatus Limnocylindria bacterium]|nr:hypothetical protein [Candidatus Limnocylindria bacterium]
MFRLLVVCAAVAAAVVPNGPASAQSPSPNPSVSGPAPVTISYCQVTRRPRYRNMTNPYPLPITGGLHLGFVNRGKSAANEIRFRVEYRGQSDLISDIGNFAPGTLVSHSFENFSDYAYLGPTPNVCAVVMVRFADGTVWSGVSHEQLRRPL